MTAHPRVTILIPTRNRASWLRESIASALAQTHANLDVLVADNASTDETPDVIRSFRDTRIRHLRRPADLGLVENHNLALAEVETEYCLILPDDDLAYPELIEKTMAVLDSRRTVGMVHTRFDLIGPNHEVLQRGIDWTVGLRRDTQETGEEFLRESMLWACRVCASTALMRMEALPLPPFDARDHPPVDVGLWLRMALDWDMAFLASTLGAYRIHPSSHSAAHGAPTRDGNLQSPALVRKIEEVKTRFVEDHRERLGRPDELIRLARWSTRRGLARSAGGRTERMAALVASAWGAVRLEPRILLRRRGWRLAFAALLGPAGLKRLRRIRA